MRWHSISMAFIVIGITGCAAKLVVSEIKPGENPGTVVNGLPFKVPKRYVAEVYEKQAGGYSMVAELPVTIADQKRLFVLGFESQTFSTATVDTQVNLDNTLSQVSLTSKSTGQATLTALGTQINALANAQMAKKTGEAGTETAASTGAIAADKAKQAADLALLIYQNAQAKSDTTAVDLLKASQAARSAQLDANEKARLAGKPPYFPDVVP
jgi:hypothetical protein